MKGLDPYCRANIALYSAETALIGTASWVIDEEHRQIVRLVASKEPKVQFKWQYDALINAKAWNIGPTFWVKYEGAIINYLIGLNNLADVPSMVRPALYYGSMHVLIDLCMDKEVAMQYCNIMRANKVLCIETANYCRCTYDELMVRWQIVLDVLFGNDIKDSFVAADDVNCATKWNNNSNARDHILKALLKRGEYDLLFEPYFQYESFTFMYWTLTNDPIDISKIIIILIRYYLEIEIVSFENNVSEEAIINFIDSSDICPAIIFGDSFRIKLLDAQYLKAFEKLEMMEEHISSTLMVLNEYIFATVAPANIVEETLYKVFELLKMYSMSKVLDPMVTLRYLINYQNGSFYVCLCDWMRTQFDPRDVDALIEYNKKRII